MSTNLEHDQNEAAFRRLEDTIRQTFPRGHFVGIAGGQIVANAPTFEKLRALLIAQGKDPVHTLIVQAGEEYPETAIILPISGAG
jgi:hypothetical protein